ncbi:MAG: hypothetical protein R3A44_22365 [Caldilineaceae bacterium]
MRQFPPNYKWTTICMMGVFVGLLLSTFSDRVSSQAGYLWGATGVGFDALTPSEQERVLAAVMSTHSEVAPAAASMPEVLLVERHQESKAAYNTGHWPRRGDAYIYDYATDTLLFALINLASGEVDAQETYQNVQLPLTQNEIDRALEIAYADDDLRTELGARFQKLTGEMLLDLNQLKVKAFVFWADSMPADLNVDAQQCGLHRCAQVLIFTHEDVAFEMQPIVDLSAGRVVQVLGQ